MTKRAADAGGAHYLRTLKAPTWAAAAGLVYVATKFERHVHARTFGSTLLLNGLALAALLVVVAYEFFNAAASGTVAQSLSAWAEVLLLSVPAGYFASALIVAGNGIRRATAPPEAEKPSGPKRAE